MVPKLEEHENALSLDVQAEEDKEKRQKRKPDHEDDRDDGEAASPVHVVGCDVVVSASNFEVGVQNHQDEVSSCEEAEGDQDEDVQW